MTNKANSEQQLDLILNDTKKLMALAEEGDWSALIELEKNRDAQIKQLFVEQPDIEQGKLAKGIEFILEKNEILSQYSHSQKDSIRLELSKAGHAHKAISSYLSS